MIITNLVRLQSQCFPIFTSPLTQFFISKTPKKQFLIYSALLSKPFSTTLFTKTPERNPSRVQEPKNREKIESSHIELSLEKLFLPPDTDVSSLTTPLSARVLKGSNIVLSKYATDAQVDHAEFIKSSVRTEDCPSDGLPEFALVGRSNVGKSSLLNSLVRRKRLALTSKKPGKTQCINHFKINNNWYLVDLPGYGYAAAPQELRTDWDKFTKDYFLCRSNLISVFLLIDASIPVKKIDLDYASWLGQNQIPMTLVFTKCDKRKKKKNGGKRSEENVQGFQELIRDFFQTALPWIMTSSVTRMVEKEKAIFDYKLEEEPSLFPF